jgi:opacity protein-like surface antigen
LDGQWEVALQAGVFSVFNMNTSSNDLVNADYTVGLLTSYRTGPFSGFLRFHHQSSHLGDEFILNSQPPINRINLSFEELDIKISYELASWFRIYGGGGILMGRDPSDLKRGTSQVGTELTSPWTLWGGKVRPVAYADFQANERSNWRVASSVMAGLQFENARIGDRKVQVLAEYFGGPSPNGQFYTQDTEWFGVGVHLYY